MLNKESEIFKTAYEGVLKYINILDNVGESKEVSDAGTGLEGWFQTVLLDSFLRKGYNVRMKGKQKRGCDIIVNNVGVELRTLINRGTGIGFLREGLKKHPKADCYMFLTRTMIKDRFINYLEQNGYVEKHKQLNPQWMIWIVKRR